MSGAVSILGPDGRPLPPSRPKGILGGMRRMALNGGIGSTPYDAADRMSSHMAAWNPALWSADTELNPWRDRIAARNRDVERNDGWAKSGIQRIADNVVGNAIRPLSKPDYRALAHYTGNSAFDASWAAEFGHAVEACWRTWADDVGHYCDAMQCLSVGQLLYLGYRGKLIDGDALAVMMYRPDQIGPGRARYATCIQIVDPDRLSNPQQQFDQQNMRGGVQVDNFGVPTGYWIRQAHQGDWYNAAQSVTWDLIPRNTEWGRPLVIHDYDHDRAAQHRGGAGVLSPVLQRLKMLIKYDGVELDAAIINAIFAAYVQSPYDQAQVEQAMGLSSEDADFEASAYQGLRNDFWGTRRPVIGTAQMTFLAPGETIGTVAAARPTSNFEPFERRILLHIAAGLGITYEQLTGDFSGSNYSSFRGALAEVQKTFDRRKTGFENGFVNPIMRCFVEEIMDVEDMPMPRGSRIPEFSDFPTAFSRCQWLGPSVNVIDELKENQGAIMGIEGGLGSLPMEAAKRGLDWEEIADQTKVVSDKYKELGIPLPSSLAAPPPGKEPGDISAPGAPGGDG